MTPYFDESRKYLKRMHPNSWFVVTAIASDDRKKNKIVTTTFDGIDDPTFFPWIEKYNTFDTYGIYYMPSRTLRPMTTKVAETDVKEVPFFVVDIDPRAGEPLEAEQERILALLRNPPEGVPLPTAIVFSGGGYQALWKLEIPIPINGEKARYEDAKLYNRWLADKLGGDSCISTDHLFRLPGTVNHPSEKKRKAGRTSKMAKVIEWHDDRVYPLEAFDKAKVSPAVEQFGVNVEVDTSNVPRLTSVDDLPDGVDDRAKILIAQGEDPDDDQAHESRSEPLFYVCCELVRADVPDDLIYGILTDPGWGISESILEKKSAAQRYALRQIKRAQEEVAKSCPLRRLNLSHAVVKYYAKNKCVVMREWPDGSVSYMSPPNFKDAHAAQRVQVGVDAQDNPKFAPAGVAWWNWTKRKEFDEVRFLPGSDAPPGVYNTFRGFPVDPVPGDEPLIVDLLHEVIFGEHFEWAMDWLAHLIQKPGEPGQVAIVLRGPQGHGKGFFVERVGELLGAYYATVTDSKHLTGNFNAHLRDRLLIYADETFGTASKQHQGMLKTLVTNGDILIEPKGVDSYMDKRYFRLIMASNEAWVVPADVDDRRFFVTDVRHPIEDEDDRLAYFAELDRCWRNGGREAFLHLLMTRDISGYNHRQRPKTAALVEQKQFTFTGPKRYMFAALQDGEITTSLADGPRVFVPSGAWRDSLGLDKAKATALGRELGKAAGGDTTTRESVDGKRVRGFWLPSLTEARANWAEAHGLDIRWPEDPDSWEAAGESEVPF
ncbi:MAG: DUF5906 domain-containing protein [Planctomycetota bacterium]